MSHDKNVMTVVATNGRSQRPHSASPEPSPQLADGAANGRGREFLVIPDFVQKVEVGHVLIRSARQSRQQPERSRMSEPKRFTVPSHRKGRLVQ